MSDETQTQENTPVIRDGQDSFGLISRFNHWIGAALFLTTLGIGLYMAYGGLPRESRFAVMNWHKAFGVAALVIGIWRVVWRLRSGFPAPVPGMPNWQEYAAKLMHWALLFVIIAMPLSGVLMSIAAGRDLSVFNVTLFPAIGKYDWLDKAAETFHEGSVLFLVAIVALHIAAAFKHQLVDRDRTLKRMTRG